MVKHLVKALNGARIRLEFREPNSQIASPPGLCWETCRGQVGGQERLVLRLSLGKRGLRGFQFPDRY